VRASMFRVARSSNLRPSLLRNAGVTSKKRRPAPSVRGTGPAYRSDGGWPNSVDIEEPISLNACRPIGVNGRYTPWATLNEKYTRKSASVVGGAGGQREQRRDRPGLEQPDPVVGVDRPLRVLRRPVVGLDPRPERYQGMDLNIR
jgi:hypothetical protein